MFCDNYPEEQKKRTADKIYKTADGTELFEVTISTYHGIDSDDEFASKVDDDGYIELIDGTKMKFETVKRNGFDTLQILGSTDNGDTIEMVSEELA